MKETLKPWNLLLTCNEIFNCVYHINIFFPNDNSTSAQYTTHELLFDDVLNLLY